MAKDNNIQKDYNLYNIKYENNNNVNYPFNLDPHDPDYPFSTEHHGVDLNFVYEDLLSAVKGTAYTFNNGGTGFGNHIIVKAPDGLLYLYGHLSKFLIKNGQKIEVGDKIAITGNTGRSTGPHLHFEIRQNSVIGLGYGTTGMPIDPAEWRKWVRKGAKIGTFVKKASTPTNTGWKQNKHGTWYKQEFGTYTNGNQAIPNRLVGPFTSNAIGFYFQAFGWANYDEVMLSSEYYGGRWYRYVWIGYTWLGVRYYLPIREWNGVAPGKPGYWVGPLWGTIT